MALMASGGAAATTFVYEGRLDDHGQPANGRYELVLQAFRDPHSASAMTAPIMFYDVPVDAGRFRLEFDLPLTDADAAWLELAVREANSAAAPSRLPGRSKATATMLIGQCWSSTGDADSNPAVNFLGTTDNQPLVLRTANARSLRIEPASITFGSLPITSNMIGGSNANTVTAGVRGATISGGGVPSGLSDPTFVNEGPNRVTEHFGTVGGGYNNLAGDDAGTTADRPFATVGGGSLNIASERDSTVGGGSENTASGRRSTVTGGYQNCAGGFASWAGGQRAKVRPGTDTGATGTSGGCADVAVAPIDGGDAGTFVWADALAADFVSTGTGQFLVRAGGGVALNSNILPTGIDLVVASRTAGGNSDLMLRSRDSATAVNLAAAADGTLFVARVNVANPEAPAFTDYARWTNTGVFRLFFDNPIKPTAGGFAAASDARLKHDVQDMHAVLDRLLALRGVQFRYREDAPDGFFAPGLLTGFIAQEVEAVFPDWVSEHPSGYKLVAPKGFDALVVEALRELRIEKDVQIEALRAHNATLEARLAALERAMAAMQGRRP